MKASAPSGMRQIYHPFASPKDLDACSAMSMPAVRRTNRAGSPEKRPASPGMFFLDRPRLFLYNEGKTGSNREPGEDEDGPVNRERNRQAGGHEARRRKTCGGPF